MLPYESTTQSTFEMLLCLARAHANFGNVRTAYPNFGTVLYGLPQFWKNDGQTVKSRAEFLWATIPT